jgi:SH3-like domain-containing protein
VITARDRAGSIVAVVVVKEAVVRFGPLAESQSAFVARDGAEFRVTDRKDAWLKVEDALGREGWLLGNQVIQLQAGQVISAPAPAGAGVPLQAAAPASNR